MLGDDEVNYLAKLMHHKPSNYQLAYLMTLARAKVGGDDLTGTFHQVLTMLNEADAAEGGSKKKN
jgi:hypothetical protein